MTTETERERLPWRLKPFPELVRLAWPITVSMLSYSVMTLVDTLFVGRLGANSLAAVGLGGTISFTVLCFGIGALRAEKIVVSMAAGAGRRDRVASATGAGFVLAGFLGLGAALVGILVAPLLPWLATTREAGALAAEYVTARSAGAPLFLLGFSIRQARQAFGDAQGPMRAALWANVANVLFAALFIFGFELGVAGAGWASALAQGVELGILLLAQRESGLGLDAWTRADLLQQWRLGWPQGFERLLDVSSFTLMVVLFARMGAADIAAHQIGMQLLHFCFLPGMAVAEAVSVLAGQAVGAAEIGLVRQVTRYGVRLAFIYMIPWAILFVLAGAPLARAFTSDIEVIARTSTLLTLGAALVLAQPLYTVTQGVLRGVGDVRYAVVVTVGAAWIFTPLFAAILGIGLGWGAVGGWTGLLFEVSVASVLFHRRLRAGAWARGVRAAAADEAVWAGAADKRRAPRRAELHPGHAGS